MKAFLLRNSYFLFVICCFIYVGVVNYHRTTAYEAEIAAKNTEIVALKAENSTLAVRNRTLQATLNACAAKRPVFRPHRAASTSTPTVLGWPVHK